MKDKSLLLGLTGELPLFKIVDFLVENKGMDFTKKDIIDGAELSRASLFKNWPTLEQHGIVKVTRQFGKTKLYTLNSKSLVTKKILDLEKALIKESLLRSSMTKEELISA
jgi:hypothetical protein